MAKEILKPNQVAAPTLFIGVGGTGCDIVKRVAEMCRPEEKENVNFACLDTNVNDLNSVAKTALTVGVGTVLDAKEVVIMVNGHNKARALYHAVEGPVMQMWTISALQMHQHGIIVCDEAATDELTHGTYKYFKDIEKDNL